MTSRFLFFATLLLISFGLVTCATETYPEEGIFETESGFFSSYFPSPPEVEVEYGPNKTLEKESMLLTQGERLTRSGHVLIYGEREVSRYETIPYEVLSAFGINSVDVGRTFKHEPTGLKGYKVEGQKSSGNLLVDERKNLTIYSFGQENSLDNRILKNRALSGVTLEFKINIKPQVELESGWKFIRKYDNYSDTLHFSELEATVQDSTLGVYSIVFAAENCFPKELVIDTRGAQIGGNFIYTNDLGIKLEEGMDTPRSPLGRLYFDAEQTTFKWDIPEE